MKGNIMDGVVIEEHNEAFLILQRLFTKYHTAYNLVHVDKHTDLSEPIVSLDLLKMNSEKSQLEITYQWLRDADYILPLLYTGAVSRVFWLGLSKSEMVTSIRVVCKKIPNSNGEVMLETRNNSDLSKGVLLSQCDEHSRIVGLLNGPTALSIDLDYFICNDFEGEKTTIEISEQEYTMYMNDKMHPLRVNFGGRCRVFKVEDNYFAMLSTIQPDAQSPVGMCVVRQRLNSFFDFVKRNISDPQIIIICKSEISGYCPSDYVDFLLKKIMAHFKGTNFRSMNDDTILGSNLDKSSEK